MCRRLALAALLLSGCGEKPDTVAVGEAAPVAFPSARPRFSDGDTTYADTEFGDTVFVDTFSVRPDSVRLGPSASAMPDAPDASAAPDFRAFWPGFVASVRTGRLPDVAGAQALRRDPFRPVVLALTARDATRESTEARTARAVVGFDAAGRVVPQDEAVRDSALVLRFEVVDGAWRLIRARLEG